MAEEQKAAQTETTGQEAKRGRPWLTTLIGFSAGAVVGAVTALLLAPQSGVETRKKIKERMGDVSEQAGKLIERSKEALEEAKDRMSAAYEDAVEKTTSIIEKAKGKSSGKHDDTEV